MKCEYGCMEEAHFQLKNGKWCCCKHHMQCPVKRREISKRNTGKKRLDMSGENHHFYGKKRTEFSKNISGENHPMFGVRGEKHFNYGRKRPDQSERMKGDKNPAKKLVVRKKISAGNIGKHSGKNNAMWKGNPESIERRKKLSIARAGSKTSKETRKKQSEARTGNPKVCGVNHPMWKGGISFEPYCEIWSDQEYKESIKERDGYKCLNAECNKTCNKLCIHHIDYIKKNCNPLNLITICISCNSKANKNRKWHKAWYHAIIERRYCE